LFNYGDFLFLKHWKLHDFSAMDNVFFITTLGLAIGAVIILTLEEIACSYARTKRNDKKASLQQQLHAIKKTKAVTKPQDMVRATSQEWIYNFAAGTQKHMLKSLEPLIKNTKTLQNSAGSRNDFHDIFSRKARYCFNDFRGVSLTYLTKRRHSQCGRTCSSALCVCDYLATR